MLVLFVLYSLSVLGVAFFLELVAIEGTHFLPLLPNLPSVSLAGFKLFAETSGSIPPWLRVALAGTAFLLVFLYLHPWRWIRTTVFGWWFFLAKFSVLLALATLITIFFLFLSAIHTQPLGNGIPAEVLQVAIGIPLSLVSLWFLLHIGVGLYLMSESSRTYPYLFRSQSVEALLPHQARTLCQIVEHIEEEIQGPQGQIIALEGPWGAGKSQILHVLKQVESLRAVNVGIRPDPCLRPSFQETANDTPPAPDAETEMGLSLQQRLQNLGRQVAFVYIHAWRHETDEDIHFEFFKRVITHPRVLMPGGWWRRLSTRASLRLTLRAVPRVRRIALRTAFQEAALDVETSVPLTWQHPLEQVARNIPLVFLIDELDRSHTAAVQSVLTLLRRSLDLPRTVIILSYVPQQLREKAFSPLQPGYAPDLEATKQAILRRLSSSSSLSPHTNSTGTRSQELVDAIVKVLGKAPGGRMDPGDLLRVLMETRLKQWAIETFEELSGSESAYYRTIEEKYIALRVHCLMRREPNNPREDELLQAIWHLLVSDRALQSILTRSFNLRYTSMQNAIQSAIWAGVQQALSGWSVTAFHIGLNLRALKAELYRNLRLMGQIPVATPEREVIRVLIAFSVFLAVDAALRAAYSYS